MAVSFESGLQPHAFSFHARSTTRLMQLRAGHVLSSQRRAWAPSWEPLRENARCEVAVLGGGVTGALAADALAGAGWDTVLLDKRQFAEGSTAATTALIQCELDTPLVQLRELVGRRRADGAYRAALHALQGLGGLAGELPGGCGWEAKTSVQLAGTDEELPAVQAEARARRELGLPGALLSAAEIAERFAFRRPGALFTPCAGQLDALQLTRGLLRRAADRGARLHPHTALEGVDDGGGADLALRTGNGATLRCDFLVVATGYEACRLLPKPVADLKTTFAIATEPVGEVAGWPGRCLVWETCRPYHYLRSTTDGRMLIGGGDIPYGGEPADGELLQAKKRELEAFRETLFPGVTAPTSHAWSGVFGETRDGLGYVGFLPGAPRVFFALGYGGNGISFSYLAAEALPAALRGERPETLEVFAFER